MTKKKKYFIIFILLVLFLIPRLGIIYYRSVNNINKADILLYSLYSFDYTVASLTNQNFYDLNYKNQQQRLKVINKQKGFRDNKHSFGYFEYPPLALQWIVLPGQMMTKFIDFSKKKNPVNTYMECYCLSYRLQCLLLEAFILLVFLIFAFSQKLKMGNLLCCAGYLIILCFIFPFLSYERIDIFLTFSIFISTILLLNNRYKLSFLFLALATCFKIVPVILLPIWILGSIEKKYYKYWKDVLLQIIKKSLLFFAFCLLFTVPFIGIYGFHSLNFLLYHFKRGIQVESLYGNILLITGKIINYQNSVYFDYGSFNVKNILYFNTMFLTVIMLVIFIFLYLYMFILLSKNEVDSNEENRVVLVKFAECAIIIFLLCSKVFSPQYYLWLTPLFLFEIAFSEKIYRNINIWVFIFSALCTEILSLRYSLLLSQSFIGIFLLSLRNILLIILVCNLFVNIYRIRKNS